MIGSLKDVLIVGGGGSALVGVLTFAALRGMQALGIIDANYGHISLSLPVTAEISELERLANQPQLVAPIPYDNAERNEQIFYDFVKQYGELMGISVSEEKLSYLLWKIFKGDIIDYFENLIYSLESIKNISEGINIDINYKNQISAFPKIIEKIKN